MPTQTEEFDDSLKIPKQRYISPEKHQQITEELTYKK